MNKYIPVIGLEIHVELSTGSKMFCQCPADWFGREPNSQTCPVCLGLPGALPVPNKKAIEWTILIAKALGCKINKVSKFDRKHYFYPDLPKGYQISQYDEPVGASGLLKLKVKSEKLKVEEKSFGITRVHLEEDTGKLIHKDGETLVDFNRSGVPLVEIVTEPDFDNSDDVKRFLEELQTVLRYLGVSDCDMEKGSMRLEPNISVREVQNSKFKIQNVLPDYKVEIKNINSFRFVKKAIDYELERQSEILEKGETPTQETRGWDDSKGVTVAQRSKEKSHDYRYFPEPDIPPLSFEDKYLSSIVVPDLPSQAVERLAGEYGLKEEDSFILTREKKKVDYFERVMGKIGDIGEKGKKVAALIINNKISTDLAIDEFVKTALQLLTPKQTDGAALSAAIEKVLMENPDAVASYRAGKTTVIMFLVGQVMREMGGQAEATIVKNKLERQLHNDQ